MENIADDDDHNEVHDNTGPLGLINIISGGNQPAEKNRWRGTKGIGSAHTKENSNEST